MLKKMLNYCKFMLILALLLSITPLGSGRADAWVGMPMGKLHVSGKNLVNSSNQPVVMSGWHQPSGAYWTYQNSNYYLSRNGNNRHAATLAYLKEITDTFTSTSPKYGSSHGWNMNQIRLFIDREDMGDVAAGTYNFAGVQTVTQNVIIPYIQYAKTKGVYVTLGLDFTLKDDQATTTANLQKFNQIWGYLASRPEIKSADNVHFELINEPVKSYANGHWGGYNGENDFVDHWNDLRNFQNSIISTIRSQGADNVIWAAGLGYNQFYSLTASHPLTDPLNNYGYAVHWYPGYGAHDNMSILQDQWNTNVKAAADKYPINITEVTWFKTKPGDSEYWNLFNGSNEGFGNNTKTIFNAAGNVSIAAHMNGFILDAGERSSFADPTAGLKWDGDASRSAMGRFLFDWFYERAQSYPNGGTPSTGLTPGATYKIVARHSGKVIDVPGGVNENNLQLQQWSDLGGNPQKWVLTQIASGIYSLTSVNSPDKVIDIRNGTSNNGEAVQLMNNLNTTAQHFKINDLGNGYWSIINVNSNKAIEVAGSSTADGAKLQQNGFINATNQQWKFVAVNN
ncbi:Ricin-type beta-trefoil lectin domain-like [Paenibacillus sp. ov031]|uniref:RICIN domain-containing protein n=1 Tax=Paenibacillus sp. ov031 TaxID=1761879 RepID=UPI00091546B4|nr:RICIN domain-containing protein [Paenibacillus sp. ov031]SHN59718.1 Ricin-type beta-trefoil lectin domain-like [Paenibacillus sp. ov031]